MGNFRQVIFDRYATSRHHLAGNLEMEFENIRQINQATALNVMHFGARGDGSNNDVTAVQRAFDKAVELGVGRIFFPAGKYVLDSFPAWDEKHCIQIIGEGSERLAHTNSLTSFSFTGSGAFITISNSKGIGFENIFIIDDSGNTGTSCFTLEGIQNSFFRNVHVRGFDDHGWKLDTDPDASTIYNTFINITAHFVSNAGGTGTGLIMAEKDAKVVNNNLFHTCHFSSNDFGVDQQSDCNDNSFHNIELVSNNDTGFKVGGRVFIQGNIESNTTYGVDIPAAASSGATLFAIVHAANNGTEFNNPSDNRAFWWNTGNELSYDGRGLATGAQTPPAAGFNFRAGPSSEDPVIQRAGTDHIELNSGNTQFKTDVGVNTASPSGDIAWGTILEIEDSASAALVLHDTGQTGEYSIAAHIDRLRFTFNGTEMMSLESNPAANDGDVKIQATQTDHAALELDTQASATAGVLHIKYNGTTASAAIMTAGETAWQAHNRDLGNDVTGPQFRIGRNTNSTNSSAGSIRMTDKSGTDYYLWVDDTGVLRINTSAPTGTTDTSGTVVGTQT